ncbi:taste receptor type 2 member 125-like [Apodemus sylvaticus]|uniref:taste receptor type 2 member 125-like n=1 Tax=Apodemus sylvaticus TaxID=10129 RepID=UPI002242D644|nr:taste receptor type 2 member 125-like [Apodemus sylvaticus]
MHAFLHYILTIIFILEFFIGNLGNGFIALVHCMDSLRRRKLPSADHFVTALAISRLALIWVLFLDLFVFVKSPLLMTRNTLRLSLTAWNISNHFSMWFATSLSIFYLFKIAIFSNSLFLYLKWRVKRLVLVTQLLSMILLFLNIVLEIKHIDVWIYVAKRNISNDLSSNRFSEFSRLLLTPSLMFTLVPFGVSLIAFLLLIFSLTKHVRKRQYYTKGYRDVRTMAHITALQTVVAFLLFYATFFLSLVVEVSTFEMNETLMLLFSKVTITIFPSIHSCTFILRHNKLRQDLYSVLKWLQYWCKCVKTLNS